ncbi:hypothetical protein ES705_14064 [subsurface metagenome]|jgi:hypothetical protein
MDKSTILAMEAGEGLDKLVAVEVMGELMPEPTPENALDLQLAGSPVKSPKGNWLCLCRYDEGDIPTWRPLPYSTDIAAAWPVVERMRSMEDGQGSALLCCLTIYSDHDLCWDIRWRYSELSNRNDGHKEHRLPTCYDDFPEAICKAALLTKLAG